jgi:hypothetical protein
MRATILYLAACLVTGTSVASETSSVHPSARTDGSEIAAPAGNQLSESASDSPATDSASTNQPKSATLSRAELCQTAFQVAQHNHLPVPFFTRLIQQESGFNPHVVSSAGAQGIAQFMPRTASSRGLVDPFEPVGALAASAKYVAELARQFGNLGLAAAAYNAGPRRVEDWINKRSKLPAETRKYVHSITGRAADDWATARIGNSEPQFSGHIGCPAALQTEAKIPASLHSWQLPATGAANSHGKAAATLEQRSLPRPSQFAIGRPVSAAIKATEARVMAKWHEKQRHAHLTRVATR